MAEALVEVDPQAADAEAPPPQQEMGPIDPEQKRLARLKVLEEGEKPSDKGFSELDVDGVVEWMSLLRFGQATPPVEQLPDSYVDIIRENQVKGKNFLLLQKGDFKAMGMPSLGDRLALRAQLQRLKTAERGRLRQTIIRQEYQAYEGSSVGLAFAYCCGLCPRDPDKYILTTTKLKLKEKEVYRVCGTCKCVCCGGTWKTNNISLGMMRDVEPTDTTTGLLCFSENKTSIKLAVKAGNEEDENDEQARIESHILFVNMPEDKDDTFAKAILNQMEEYKLAQDAGII